VSLGRGFSNGKTFSSLAKQKTFVSRILFWIYSLKNNALLLAVNCENRHCSRQGRLRFPKNSGINIGYQQTSVVWVPVWDGSEVTVTCCKQTW